MIRKKKKSRKRMFFLVQTKYILRHVAYSCSEIPYSAKKLTWFLVFELQAHACFSLLINTFHT